MEEMKNRFCLLLSLLFIILLASCATTSAGASDINSDITIEKKQSKKSYYSKTGNIKVLDIRCRPGSKQLIKMMSAELKNQLLTFWTVRLLY